MSFLKNNLTIKLIIINIIVFTITLGGLLFSEYLANYWRYSILNLQFYRFFTCVFFHFGISHLVCNTISLFQLGNIIEIAYGKKAYLYIYILSGIGSSIFSAVINMILQRNSLSAGASGAICGLLGAVLASIKGNKKSTILNVILALIPLIFLGIQPGVDNIAHFSGVFIGFTIGQKTNKKRF